MSIAHTVDQLGQVQAQIANLRELEKQLKGEILDHGSAEGDLFKATVVESERSTVNWKAVANKLCPSHQLVRANTKRQQVFAVKVTARPTCARQEAA